MPGLARKIIICAAVDGLVLHQLSSRKEPQSHQRSSSSPLAPVRIRYGDASVSVISRDAAPDLSSLPPNSSFEAYGIVGMSPGLRIHPFLFIEKFKTHLASPAHVKAFVHVHTWFILVILVRS